MESGVVRMTIGDGFSGWEGSVDGLKADGFSCVSCELRLWEFKE